MINIDSIESQTNQGATKPLRCICEYGKSYIVKFEGGMTIDELVKEWLGASLAKEFGLNVPPFDQAFLDQLLITDFEFAESTPSEEICFASLFIDDATEFNIVLNKQIPLNTRQDIFVFDLWVQNHDRNLTELGGNVNLLWSSVQGLCVIDHNLILSVEEDFAKTHVFRDAGEEVFGDMHLRAKYQERLSMVMEKWDDIVSSIPKEWIDSEQLTMDICEIRNALIEAANGGLWSQMS